MDVKRSYHKSELPLVFQTFEWNPVVIIFIIGWNFCAFFPFIFGRQAAQIHQPHSNFLLNRKLKSEIFLTCCKSRQYFLFYFSFFYLIFQMKSTVSEDSHSKTVLKWNELFNGCFYVNTVKILSKDRQEQEDFEYSRKYGTH